MKTLSVAFLIVLSFLSFSCKKKKGCTDPYSFNYSKDAEVNDGSCQDMGSCLGYAGGMNNSGTVGVSFYNSYYDQKMVEEIAIQRQFFQDIPANVYVLYEPSVEMKNAYASSDGNIYFGYHLLYYTVQMYGELPVAGVLAHEWGHRTQQIIGWNDYYKAEHKELEADAFSGFYMALAKQWAWERIEGFFQNVYASGNYLFNSPNFHGTPDQRLASANLGVTTAVYALQHGIQYSYNELHQIFFGEISTNIAHRSTGRNYHEVIYPENMSEQYIKSLFPKR